MDTASTLMNKKASAKHNGDNSDSDDDDDASKIVRENNHVYFYSEVSRESIFKLNIFLREAEKFVYTTSFDLNLSLTCFTCPTKWILPVTFICFVLVFIIKKIYYVPYGGYPSPHNRRS